MSYYVWVWRKDDSGPKKTEGPYGPYGNLNSAKQYARISAQKGEHDRVVSRGMPGAKSFLVLRKYEAGTGERLG